MITRHHGSYFLLFARLSVFPMMWFLLLTFVSLVIIADTCIASPADNIRSKLCQPPKSISKVIVKCTDQAVLLRFRYCATETEGDIYIAKCHYFQLEGHNVTEPGYIRLPDNISELNDYMCGPMNRKGLLCKDCIDGFGPSVTSLGYKCSNCTDAWYGIPLYLAVELIPITLFYLIILIFKINLISPPMVLFILLNQLIMYELIFPRTRRLGILLSQGMHSNGPLLRSLFFFCGIWNLKFIHSIMPPFCVSNKLQLIHVEFLGYVPVIYLLLLIFLTWICIELHGQNYKLLVVLWRPFHRCFVRLQRGWDKTSSMVDVFASFFLLSNSTLLYQVVTIFRCQKLFHSMSKEPNDYVLMFLPYIECNHRPYPMLIFSALLLLIFDIIPILLLVLYPFKLFRMCLSKCKLDRLFVTIFVEKFHGYYRDGLNGGRDMRSFSGLYYLMMILLSCYWAFDVKRWHISSQLYYALIFLSFSLLMTIVRPYKHNYMNILDTLLLAYATVICMLLSRDSFAGEGTQIFIAVLIPSIIFGLIIVFKAFNKLKNSLFEKFKCYFKQCPIHNRVDSEENNALISPLHSYGTYGGK